MRGAELKDGSHRQGVRLNHSRCRRNPVIRRPDGLVRRRHTLPPLSSLV